MNRRSRLQTLCSAVLTIGLILTGAPRSSAQQPATSDFAGYLQLVAARARSEGVGEATITRMLSGLTPNQRVIELDQAQPGMQPTPPPMAPYLSRHVDSSRIAGGRRVYTEAGTQIAEIENTYGVPAKMAIAIFGHETNYGIYTGTFDLARSLATLAWEGRRRALFEGELIALMKMADQGVPAYRLQGSWAGAFGNPQFLPSVYLTTAADGDRDGDRDIWSSRADTLASIANYFRKAGWRSGEPWGVPAAIPGGFGWSGVTSRMAPPTCNRVLDRHTAWKPVSEWRALGVTPLGAIRDTTMATLFQPDGPGTRAFLLTGNYRVILQYNCSNYYALSVGLLADEIAR